MSRPRPALVYLQGRAAQCALGTHLDLARVALRSPPSPAMPLELGHGATATTVPVRWRPPPAPVGGPDDSPRAWEQRCRERVQQVLRAAGASPEGGLILASSSFEMGALERGGDWAADGLAWAEDLARAAGWQGPVVTVNTACTASLNALRVARDWLRAAPELATVTVLGLEEGNRYALAGFAALQIMGPGRPLVAGEATAALVLGRRPTRWRLAGAGHRICGTDPGAADATALSAAIDEALEDGGVVAADIVGVLGHATGQPRNDATEAAVLDARLPHAPRLHYKPWLGHTQGACTALELALWMDQVEAGETPLPMAPLPMDTPRAVLALALGFGGSHGALVIEHRPPGMEDAGSAAPGVPSADRSVRHRADSLQDEDPPPDWPARLATRLGTRPRRLGPWAELALWGARRCLDGAGLDALPAGARLCVLSLSGPVETLREGLKALDQDGAPMPYTFLQSQPAVMLAGLGAHLGWQGDALCLATRDLVHGPGWLAPEGGLLLGWVDERPRPVSRWQWWAPGGERHLT